MSFNENKSVFICLIKLMRPKQWIKNGFVLAPLLFTGYFLSNNALLHAFLATLLFCVASSAAYIVNDIQDIEQDKQHLKKALTRPLASGQLKLSQAIIWLGVLYLILALGYFAEPNVVLVILTYLLLNFAYTFALKHQPVIDIFCIALGFVLRVYAGAMALNVPLSSWMCVTTLCLALYLAAIKRRQELVKSDSEARKVLEHYSIELIDRYAQMSAIGALLFYSLFVMTERPEMVMTIPFVLYGLFRYWYIVETHEEGESPTDALFSDWQLIFTILLWVGVCLWAIT